MDEWQDASYLLSELGVKKDTGIIYRLVNKDDEVIYIGQTRKTVLERLSGHSREKPWFNLIKKVEIREVPLYDLDFLEGVEIHTYHPSGNKSCPLMINGIRMCKYYYSGKTYSVDSAIKELDALLAAQEDKRAKSLRNV